MRTPFYSFELQGAWLGMYSIMSFMINGRCGARATGRAAGTSATPEGQPTARTPHVGLVRPRPGPGPHGYPALEPFGAVRSVGIPGCARA
jgi:hypothetical protein